MNAKRLRELPISNLEYLFSPAGLPLVNKGKQDSPNVPTTSILVRGSAGAGKTTLSVALASAIAKANGGLVLYLSTEIVPTELLFKTDLLGFSEPGVHSWKDRGAGQIGTLVVQHMQLAQNDQEAEFDNNTRRREAIDVLWDLLDTYKNERHPVPIRAVVMDAFGLPNGLPEEPRLRSEVLALVQALEGEGVSSILIEELGTGTTDTLTFLVDIVFELSLSSDPDTSELVRKLKCPKSRYAFALTGPHDYGLDFKRPAVWPDPLAVLTHLSPNIPSQFVISQDRIASFIWPSTNEPGKFLAVRGGSVVLSHIEDKPSILDVCANSPGITSVYVHCGPRINVSSKLTEFKGSTSPAAEGPFSSIWQILKLLNKGVNTVVFQQIDSLLSRQRFRIPLLHVLDALRMTRTLTIICGRSENIASLRSMAEFVPGESGHFRTDLIHQIPTFWLCPGTRWLVDWTVLALPAPINSDDGTRVQTIPSQLAAIHQYIYSGALADAESQLRSLSIPLASPAARALNAQQAWYYHLLGLQDDAMRLATSCQQFNSPEAEFRLPWLYLLTGQDWLASRSITESWPRQQNPSARLLWVALCALYAGTNAALEELEQTTGKLQENLALWPRLRTLALQGRFADADRYIDDFSHRQALPQWTAERIKSECRIEAKDNEIISEAVHRLERLVGDTNLPALQQAEICNNIGIANERLGDNAATMKWLHRALELNPKLEISSRKIVSLGGSALLQKPPAR